MLNGTSYMDTAIADLQNLGPVDKCKTFAQIIRLKCVDTIYKVQYGHPATDLCVADIMGVLYGQILDVDAAKPQDPERDRLIVSKGHASLALYVALALRRYLPLEEIATFTRPHSRLCAAVSTRTPGVEANTGALGHGLPIAVGCALAARLDGSPRRVFCLVGDGELQEGSNWEAFMLAASRKLNNLIVIIDRNRVQKGADTELTNGLDPLDEKLESFGIEAREVNGHSVEELLAVLRPDPGRERPLAVIANTIKGKGVSFMENDLRWHNRKLDAHHYEIAMKELS